MAAVALVMAACTNDDNAIQQEQQAAMIPFEATISAPGEMTRTTVSQSGDELLVAWKGGEEIALVHQGIKEVVTVTALNPDGTAIISGDITAPLTENEAVELVYPARAVKTILGGAVAMLDNDTEFLPPYFAQDGTNTYTYTREEALILRNGKYYQSTVTMTDSCCP